MDSETAEINVLSNSSEFPSLTPANFISRNGIVQGVLNLFADPSYLEIGVNKGMTFNALKAARKVAVDPKFLFDTEAVAAQDPSCAFHEITSDDYFGRIADRGDPFDVIYLDGLHTSEQTIRDLINAISFLKRDGVIVIDDVFPSSYVAALPDRHHTRVIRKATGDTAGAWMGDVYRLVFFVETFCQQFSYATVNNNHGQLVMWQEPRPRVIERTLTQVGEMDYKDLFLEKDSLNFSPLDQILERIVATRSATSNRS